MHCKDGPDESKESGVVSLKGQPLFRSGYDTVHERFLNKCFTLLNLTVEGLVIVLCTFIKLNNPNSFILPKFKGVCILCL